MSPPDIKPGLRVWYRPTTGGKRYAGVVDTEAWQLGHGTWVCHLSEMEPAYGIETGRPNRTTVAAAALTHLELR